MFNPHYLEFCPKPLKSGYKGVSNYMPEKGPVNTKTDIMDLLISFFIEHEKQMDIIIERLERILEKANKNGYQFAKTLSPLNISPSEYGKFTFAIENPEDLKKIKSIKIDWVSEEKSY